MGLLWIPRSWSGGEARAIPLPGQKHRHPPAQRWPARSEGGWGGAGHPFLVPWARLAASAPLPSLNATHPSSRGWPPGCAVARGCLLTLRAGGVEAAAAPPAHTPAGRRLAPFVSAGQCPRRLPRPAQPRTPLPQVLKTLSRAGAGEPRLGAPRRSPQREQGLQGGGGEQEAGDEGWRGLERKGRGAWWRGGEANGLRYANSQEDCVSPPHGAPDPSGPPEVAREQRFRIRGAWLGYRVMLGPCLLQRRTGGQACTRVRDIAAGGAGIPKCWLHPRS